jgi:hypothetical protein
MLIHPSVKSLTLSLPAACATSTCSLFCSVQLYSADIPSPSRHWQPSYLQVYLLTHRILPQILDKRLCYIYPSGQATIVSRSMRFRIGESIFCHLNRHWTAQSRMSLCARIPACLPPRSKRARTAKTYCKLTPVFPHSARTESRVVLYASEKV